MQMQMKQYVKRLTFIGLVLLVIVVGINWLVDPYGLFNSPKFVGINALKPEFSARMVKAYAVRDVKPRAIVLGTSLAELGIDPEHAGWSYQPTYNLGLEGANTYEMLRYFQHSENIQPLKQVLLFWDFLSFSDEQVNEVDFSEARLSVSYDGQ